VASPLNLQGLHLPSPPPPQQGGTAAPAPTPAAKKSLDDSSSISFSSSSFSDSDEDSGWDDDESPAAPVAAPRMRGSSSAAAGAAASLAAPFSASADAHLSDEQIEAEVEASVLAWARGKSVASMLQSAPSVFFGPLPEVSSGLQTAGPQDVRKAYLRAVRCCHPDKQPADAAPRVRLQAAKVFSALSDAYAAFKQANGLL